MPAASLSPRMPMTAIVRPRAPPGSGARRAARRAPARPARCGRRRGSTPPRPARTWKRPGSCTRRSAWPRAQRSAARAPARARELRARRHACPTHSSARARWRHCGTGSRRRAPAAAARRSVDAAAPDSPSASACTRQRKSRSAITARAPQRVDRGVDARRHRARAEHRRRAARGRCPPSRAPIELERVAEPVAMIEADGAQHRDVGVDEVGGIEPPAQPHLEHRQRRRARAAKTSERRQRVVLEEGERGRAARRLDALEGRDQRRRPRLRRRRRGCARCSAAGAAR